MIKKIVSAIMVVTMGLSSFNISAFAVEVGGTPGSTIHGEYVAVVNTGVTSQDTGVLEFDENAGEITRYGGTLDEVESDVLLPESDVIYDEVEPASISSSEHSLKANYTVGTEGTFYEGKRFVCIGVGAESYVWMEKGLYDRHTPEQRNQVGQEVSEIYEGRPLEVVKELSKGQDFYQDGSGKLSIMIQEMSNSSGFYAGEDGITAVHINGIDPKKYSFGAYGKYDGLIVHEVQHAIFRWLVCGGSKALAYELSWLNEGLSVMAMDYYWGGDDPTGWLALINNNMSIRNGSSLLYQAYRNSSVQDYSMPDLFIRYLANQKAKGYAPMEMMQAFYNGGMSVGQTVNYMNQVFLEAGLEDESGKVLTFDKALTNFYVAAVAQENTGSYGFYGDPVIRSVLTQYPIYAGSSGKSITLDGSAGIILKTNGGAFTIPSGAGSNIRFVAFDKVLDVPLPERGSGTTADPYQITKKEELLSMFMASDVSYKLMNHIDVSGMVLFPAKEFTGTFDGNGYSITGMTKPLVLTNKGTIKNLTVNGFSGEFRTWTGILSNFNSGTIADCVVTGKVDVRFTSSKAFQLPVFGTMTAQNEMSGVVSRCYTDADITVDMPVNTDYVGMIVGINKYRIHNSYSQGSLTVNEPTGNGDLNIGGIVGEQYSSLYPRPALENSYSTTKIIVNSTQANKTVGQVAGYVQTDSILNSVYGIASSLPMTTNKTDGAYAKTEQQLKDPATFVGWGMGSIWQMAPGGYPEFFKPSAGGIQVSIFQSEYYKGEELSLHNSSLIIGNGRVPLTADLLQSVDMSTAGVKTVYGVYSGVEFNFNITVKEPGNVESLEVYTKPNATYMEGELFDARGTKLRATIDGKKNIYLTSGYTVDKNASLLVSDTKVVYTYGNQTADMPIQVSGKESQIQSIKVIRSADQLSGYYAGDPLQLDGIRVQFIYQNGSKSPIYTYDSSKPDVFEALKIRFSIGLEQKVDAGQILQDKDNKQNLYVYYGDLLPREQGSIYAAVGPLEVNRALWLDDQKVQLTVNKPGFVVTDSVTGITTGSARLKSGTVPAGILVEFTTSHDFRIDGTPTDIGTTVLVYEITDNTSLRTIDVELRINVVEPSSESEITQFLVRQRLSGSEPVYNGKIDSANGIVEVLVPSTFQVADLHYTMDVSKGATGGGSMGSQNFTNPRTFTITAENGVNTKQYQVRVIKSSSAVTGKLTSPQNLKWDQGVLSWDAVADATGYMITLMKKPRDEYITGYQTSDTSVDFASHFQKRGEYFAKVVAYDDRQNYLDSNHTTSPDFQFVAPIIRGLKINESNVTLRPGESQLFTLSFDGVGDYSQEVIWSVTGNQSAGTKVVNGRLLIDESETADELIIRVTSVLDESKYEETVVSLEALSVLDAPENLQWMNHTGSWDVVSGAKAYDVTLLKDGNLIETMNGLVQPVVDFSSYITGDGHYTFRVESVASGYRNSPQVESPILNVVTNGVVSVEILERNASLEPGDKQVFTVSVMGSGVYSDKVIWSLEGNELHKDTRIDTGGILTVSVAQKDGTFFVKATSKEDSTISDRVAVVVKSSVVIPTITSVRVSPDSKTMNPGESQVFTAFVEGTGNFDDRVEWILEGRVTDSDTRMESDGTLVIGMNESDGKLVVRAISEEDSSYSGTATVIITQKVILPEITQVLITPKKAQLYPLDSEQFYADVMGNGNYDTGVEFFVEGNKKDPSTVISKDGLLTIGEGQKETTLTVWAVSTADKTKKASAKVDVFEEEIEISSVILSPEKGNMKPGMKQQFRAKVTGTGNFNPSVSWSLEGKVFDEGTRLTEDGLLIVGSKEKNTTLTIRATSVENHEKSGVAVITVKAINTPSGSGGGSGGSTGGAVKQAVPTPARQDSQGSWKSDEKGWQFLKPDGDTIRNEWVLKNGKWYYPDETGYLKTGWLQKDGAWYYLSQANGSMAEGWQFLGGAWYYLKPDGSWDEQRQFGFEVLPVEGLGSWRRESGGWSFVDHSNNRLVSQWIRISGIDYYVGADGLVHQGWLELDGKRYYLNDVTGAMESGTIFLDGQWHHL